MKILYISPYFYPAITVGGTAKTLYDLSRALVKKGHEVTVLTTDLYNVNKRVNDYHDKEEDLDGIKVIYFSNLSNTLAYKYHLFLPFKYFIYLYKNIKKYDIIHLHEIYTFMHLWAAFLARINNIPYIITAHGTMMLKKEEGRVARKNLFYCLGGKRLLDSASGIIALTKDEKKSFIRLGLKEKNIKIIPNGLNTKLYKNSGNADKFRKKFHIPGNTRILLFLGRIHQKKGINLLIKSLVHLKKDFTNLFLVIAGPVEDKDYYSTLVREVDDNKLDDSVFFTGVLSEEDKKCAYRVSDIFVLTSYAEGLPVSILEAASAGLPVLVSKYCGIPEVTSYKAGLVVDTITGDIISGIEKILSHSNYRKYFGRNGQKMVEEKFNLEKVSTDVENLYASILSRNDKS